MSNKSWSNLPSRGGNGCQGTENPKWHFGICYSTFNRLRTLTCHPSSGGANEVKGEHHGAIGHCLCLPRCGLGATGANQHLSNRSVIGPVYWVFSMIARLIGLLCSIGRTQGETVWAERVCTLQRETTCKVSLVCFVACVVDGA